ncbi:YheC/YheD family endospore coat-associated protein [Desmospora profundinema]|uniref:Glutathione synthase/RimK-type ligase-like ATP-grasp enzyme n=1 Tax=Desmospora profundinema TaxID=1571184 RepID=A0ABU1IQF7_9BACL|nr:YheC/YheD family protein [Desmospora profundinema]MDR6226653.1 glutathione synthase/RimK-type ligase-like ATP-grasp enzyme [Desmospora profundinema]
MGVARIIVQIVSERAFPPESNLILSQSIANRLRLPQHPVWITFGSAADTAFFFSTPNQTPLVRISSRLAERLKLSQQQTLNASYDPSTRRIQLGPLLGVLMNRNVEGSENQLFGLMGGFLEECAQAASERGIAFTVFPAEQVQLRAQQVKGWVFQNRSWKLVSTPLPDVVYNRITSRRIERLPHVKQVLSALRQSNRVHFFNETFLDKQQVYDMLSKDPIARTLLPESVPYHSSRLRPMLERHRFLYLKPVNGSLGQGIIRLSLFNGKWLCQYAEVNGTVTRVFPHAKEAIRQLHRKVTGSRYMIQRGLHLVTHDGRPVDFRVLVQKNGRGEWSVTSTVARVANDQHIVSNLARGGTLRKAGEILADIQSPNKPKLSQIRERALEVAQAFEREAQGHFAELGIDLVLDRQGDLWMLELNSKPSKTEDTINIPTSGSARPSVTRLLDYTLHLTGWSSILPKPVPKRSLSKRTGRRKR